MTAPHLLPQPRLIGVSPSGVLYFARRVGDAAILKARLEAQWAKVTDEKVAALARTVDAGLAAQACPARDSSPGAPHIYEGGSCAFCSVAQRGVIQS